MSFARQGLKRIRSKVAKALYNKKNKKCAIFPSEVKKIFVIGWEYKIGDYIVSAFFFRELKKIFPKAEVILLASGSHKLPSYHECIDKVIYCNRRKILQFMSLKERIKKIGSIDVCIAVTRVLTFWNYIENFYMIFRSNFQRVTVDVSSF